MHSKVLLCASVEMLATCMRLCVVHLHCKCHYWYLQVYICNCMSICREHANALRYMHALTEHMCTIEGMWMLHTL